MKKPDLDDLMIMSPQERRSLTAEKQAKEGVDISRELKNPEGLAWLSLVEETLHDRIRSLILQDPFCKGILRTLATLNRKMDVAQKATNDIMHESYKRIGIK